MTTKRHRPASALLLVAGCALLSPCSSPRQATATKPQASGPGLSTPADRTHEIVLALGPRKIDIAEFGHLLGPPPQRREQRTEGERRAEFLQELERTELLATEAERLGYAHSKAVLAAKKASMVQHLMDDSFGEHGSAVQPVRDAEVRAYYDAHIADFSSPTQVRASQIVVRSEKQARELIERFTTQPQERAHFGELSAKQSVDADTRKWAGDLGYFALATPPAPDATTSASLRPHYVAAAVRKAAFSLAQPGAIYPTPIHSELGFHVLLLTSLRPAARYELPQVQNMLRQKLDTERRDAAIEALLQQLEKNAHVRVYADKLALVRIAP
ncbi:MAG TPA: peptidyl-prolyl cis-trans isomerase [Polyangiales bacterium]